MNEPGREKGESKCKVEDVYSYIGVSITMDQLYSWGSVIHLLP